jgi:hypothetical protein
MLSVSSLIEFLMNLMRDEEAREAFDQDPQGTLSSHGLDGVSGQDVRDARLVMADNGGVRARPDHGSGSGSRYDDPVREIQHTTNNYVINEGPSVGSVDQTFNVIKIDDRDTTVVDSFNSADTTDVDVVATQDNSQTNTDIDIIDIDDSFNEEPAEGEPGSEEPEAGTDPVDSTAGDEPSDGEPTSGEPAGGEPDGGEPVNSTLGDELTDGEPAFGEPTFGGPADGEPTGSEPVGGEPDGSGSFSDEPTSGIEPADSEPDLDAAII